MAFSACLERLAQTGGLSRCVRSLSVIGQASKAFNCDEISAERWSTLSQQRFYRIPDKIKWPANPYSKICGRPAPESYPLFQEIKNANNSDSWPRQTLKIPEGVQLKVDDASRVLELEGKAGSIIFDMKKIDASGLVAYHIEKANGSEFCSTLSLVSPKQDVLDSYVKEVQKAIRGVSQGYLVGLTVKGVGYRMEPVDEVPAKYKNWHRPVYFDRTKVEKVPTTYPHKKPANAVLLKIGFSDPAVYMLPPSVKAFFLKPTIMYLYGLNLDELRKTAMDIRALRKPNVFTGNGIALLDETVRIKQRANRK